MSEPDVLLAHTSPSTDLPDGPPSPSQGITRAEWMLVIATVIWGSSFALAKSAGEAINRAAGDSQHVLGPLATLALRFTIATFVWLTLVPKARTGWTARGVRRGSTLGVLLSLGLVLQHVALDYTVEAVAAFLTSLTVVFVPLILWIFLRQKLSRAAWIGVAIAFPGVWLMSDAGGSDFHVGLGEWLGIGCAIAFAWHLPVVNAYAKLETPFRMAAAQYAMVSLICWMGTGLCALRVERFDWSALVAPSIWFNVILLAAFPTLMSFGLANIYQPRVEPVRAVLIYLLEPIFAAAFAWLLVGRGMTRGMIAGGALILFANAFVELWPMMRRRRAH